MEWVEVTAKSVEDAKRIAIDRLGVDEEDAEFEVLQQPSKGLFGLMRGEARVRARVRPTAVRPKRDRRERGARRERDAAPEKVATSGSADVEQAATESAAPAEPRRPRAESERADRRPRSRGDRGGSNGSKQQKEKQMGEHTTTETVDPAEVGAAAASFVEGLATAFGTPGTTEVVADGTELEVRLTGDDLALLIGPGGRTLAAVQDLARVAAQRRLGDHETRLKVDVAGYREKRRVALEKFATAVAADVVASGRAKALEPMSSADRKIVHDAITNIDGVSSRSDGDDPARRVVISPA